MCRVFSKLHQGPKHVSCYHQCFRDVIVISVLLYFSKAFTTIGISIVLQKTRLGSLKYILLLRCLNWIWIYRVNSLKVVKNGTFPCCKQKMSHSCLQNRNLKLETLVIHWILCSNDTLSVYAYHLWLKFHLPDKRALKVQMV